MGKKSVNILKLRKLYRHALEKQAKQYVKSKPSWLLDVKHHFAKQHKPWPLRYHHYLEYAELQHNPELFSVAIDITGHKVVYLDGILYIRRKK
jgi:hypothetical protein